MRSHKRLSLISGGACIKGVGDETHRLLVCFIPYTLILDLEKFRTLVEASGISTSISEDSGNKLIQFGFFMFFFLFSTLTA